MSETKTSLILRVGLLLGLIYLFIFSIGLLGSSLKLFGEGFAKTLIATTSNPIIGLLIGMFATSLIQSSSMTTSLLVGLVGGGMISVENAIPIVMGANIGTTITNIIVSLVHINQSNEFRRAFSASTVHDIFNLLAVAILLPIQVMTNFLGIFSTGLATLFSDAGGLKLFNPMKAITKPAISLALDSFNQSPLIGTIVGIVLLFIALSFLVRVLKSVFIERLTTLFQRYLFKTIVRSFFVGLVITVMVQSSSITTSLIIPLAGSGVLSLAQVFPYTLGANLGTTATAILAALATGNIAGVTIAFAHMLFNIAGIAIFFPLKRIPLRLAEKLANLAVKSKLFPIGFIVIIFFILPFTLIFLLR